MKQPKHFFPLLCACVCRGRGWRAGVGGKGLERSVWLNLRLTCGTGEIDEVPPSFTLCREQGRRNRTLQCGGPKLRARSRRGVPGLINGTGGPSKTALPADRAQRHSKNNRPGRGPWVLTGCSFWRKQSGALPPVVGREQGDGGDNQHKLCQLNTGSCNLAH